MTLAINQITPVIKVDGSPMPATWLDALVRMRIERGLCIIGRAVLHFTDNGYQLSAANKFGLGSKVSIALESGADLFAGIVTGAALEQASGAHPELVITVDDSACKLALGTKVVTRESTTYSSIVSELASSAGLSASASMGTMGSQNQDYLLQSSTDLAFMDELARRANCVWWVDGTTLHVAEPSATSGTATVKLGESLLDFSVRASGLRPTSVAVNGWDANAQTDITGDGGTPTKTADSTFVSSYLGSGPSSITSGTLTAGDGNPNVSAEAAALAQSLNTEWHAGAVIARGTAIVDPSIAPMAALTVQQAGPASGTYTVSEVQHVLRADGFFTTFTAGPVRPFGLVDTLGAQSPDVGFTMPGLTTGLVSDTNDPKKWGRAKIKYTGAGGQLVSNWARIVSLGGGNSRGTVFQPEVGDEVLVGFERADSRHPVIIGGLFSQNVALAADASVRGDDGKTTYRRITSRLGHYVELGDGSTPDKQHVLLQLGSPAHKLRLGADQFDLVMTQGKPISIKSGNSKFEIDAQGGITIEGTSVTIKATQQALDLEASAGQATLKGNMGVTVQGMTAAVKADTQLSLEGEAMAALKGGVVMIN